MQAKSRQRLKFMENSLKINNFGMSVLNVNEMVLQ